MLILPPLALYIHIPWCVRKCPYCDFNSHEAAAMPERDYVAQLVDDLDAALPWVQDRALVSIFFGGGTPSLFSAEAIADILAAVRARLPLAPDVEVTLEANPGTAEAGRFRAYRDAGVNRLSLGIQSFQPARLQALGRIHDGEQALAAVAAAQAAGFRRLNLDLMHGLPGQSVDEAVADLDQAIRLGVSHLSWYQLTIEPNTAFYRQPPVLPDDEALADIQQAGAAMLASAGFGQYEVSAFARPGEEARHNLNYWHFGDYLGIGAGAHGKLTLPGEGRILRTRKTRLPRHYLARTGGQDAECQPVAAADLPGEFMLNALRLRDGVPAALFEARTGLPLAAIAARREALQARGLLLPDPAHLCATPLGYRFLNDVIAAFIDV